MRDVADEHSKHAVCDRAIMQKRKEKKGGPYVKQPEEQQGTPFEDSITPSVSQYICRWVVPLKSRGHVAVNRFSSLCLRDADGSNPTPLDYKIENCDTCVEI